MTQFSVFLSGRGSKQSGGGRRDAGTDAGSAAGSQILQVDRLQQQYDMFTASSLLPKHSSQQPTGTGGTRRVLQTLCNATLQSVGPLELFR